MSPRACAVSLLIAIAACDGGRPAPIAYDVDTCTRCHMQINERRYSAVLVTRRGRSLKFDSIECLRDYAERPEVKGEITSVWVANFAHPGTMLRAVDAHFADLGASRAPMGKTHGWVAVATVVDAAAIGVDSTKLRAWSQLP